MFDLWYDLPPLARAVIGLVFIGLAVLMFFSAGPNRVSLILGCIGLISLLFAGSGQNSNGYKF